MPTTCFVTYEFHPATAGGCGVFVRHAIDDLLRQGQEVAMLIDCPEDAFATVRREMQGAASRGAKLHLFRAQDFVPRLPIVDGLSRFERDSLRFALALEAILPRVKVDLIEFFDFCGPAWAWLTRRRTTPYGSIPVAVRLHGPLHVIDAAAGFTTPDRDRYLAHALERWSLDMADVIFAPSAAYAAHVGVRERVVVSPPPFVPLPKPAATPAQRDTIVFLGNLSLAKGADLFIEACGRALANAPPDTRVLLIGPNTPDLGGMQAALETKIPEPLRSRFTFAGRLDRPQIANALAGAMMAVFPTRSESFGYALHETYDAGVPVILTPLPAFEGSFEHERNALVASATPDALAAAITRLIREPGLRERLSRPHPVASDRVSPAYLTRHASRIAPPSALPACITVVLVGMLHGMVIPPLSLPHGVGLKIVSLHAADQGVRLNGRAWEARDAHGSPIPDAELITTDALLLVRYADTLEPHLLQQLFNALVADPTLTYATFWTRSGGVSRSYALDIAPELFPFEYPGHLPPSLIRTEPGTPLAMLLPAALGVLAPCVPLWQAARKGRGISVMEPLLHETGPTPPPPSHESLASLLLISPPPCNASLAELSWLTFPGSKASSLGLDDRIKIAQGLGARMLLRLAFRRVLSVLFGGGS